MSYDSNLTSSPANFSPADQPILAELASPPPRQRSRLWVTLLVVGVVGIIFVLAIIGLLPQELQRWRLASAEEQRLSGDSQGALQRLDADIARNPRSVELRRTKAHWLFIDKKYKAALAEIDQIIAWRPADVSAYSLRSQIFHALGQHDKAVADCKRILEFDSVSAGPDRSSALNQLAYARALANVEIDEGLANIEEALRIRGEHFAMLDTRGFLYYRKGDFVRALKDLKLAVTFAEDAYASQATSATDLPTPDRRLKKLVDAQASQTIAVLRYHRGLIYQARGEAKLAAEDFRHVRELGFKPDENLF